MKLRPFSSNACKCHTPTCWKRTYKRMLCWLWRHILLMFVFWGFIVPFENFSLIWKRHHHRWRAAILTCARHLWPLSSEGSLVFKLVISEDPWHSHLLPSVWLWSCHYLFKRLRAFMSQLGFEHPIFRLRDLIYLRMKT